MIIDNQVLNYSNKGQLWCQREIGFSNCNDKDYTVLILDKKQPCDPEKWMPYHAAIKLKIPYEKYGRKQWSIFKKFKKKIEQMTLADLREALREYKTYPSKWEHLKDHVEWTDTKYDIEFIEKIMSWW